jgi:hypothetical protein
MYKQDISEEKKVKGILYEVVSILSRTGATIYTVVVVAQCNRRL